MEEEFRALLKADPALSAIVGDRIDFGTREQGGALPAIVLNTISDVKDHHMNGSGGLYQGRVQVDCYGMTYGAAKLASRAVVDALHFYRGGGFLLITHLMTRDTRESGSNEAERPYRTGLDFNTSWRPV
tara:strand:+ start:16421 stop:16807 length:387 start_codon:yes stop_codon:yes gene_type:complete